MVASPRDPDRPTALVVGCGDLGTEVGLRLAERGERVLGLRRRIEVLPPQIHGLSVDLTTTTPELPESDYRMMAVILTADASDEEGYRRTYVDGLGRALDAVAALEGHADQRITVPRAVLISSTGVYGDLVGDLDESTPPAPARATQQVLLDAEEVFRERVPHGTVLRLSGMYGPGRSTFITRAREGRVTQRWTNRIHRDDAAAATVHLLTRPEPPARLYLATDTAPVPSLEVADAIREFLGLGPHPRSGVGGGAGGERDKVESKDVEVPPGRRLSSARLRGEGFTFTYPTYREGYRAVLDGQGVRHR